MHTIANVTCPKCGADIPLTEAVAQSLRRELEAEFDRKRKDQNEALSLREQKLETDRQALLAGQKNLSETLNQRLQAERKDLLESARKEAAEKCGVEMEALRTDLAEQKARAKEAQQRELDLLKQKAELDDAKGRMELDLARRLDEERKVLRDAARAEVVETEGLKLKDKENKIKELQEQIAQLQQRASQGSTQAQGETLELALEEQLKDCFPGDEIVEVKKGQRGADIVQRVRNRQGEVCGTILWEAKRARNFGGDWIAKLKQDQMREQAELAVLVSTQLPEGIESIGEREGVWICAPAFACPLAAALRRGVLDVAVARVQQDGKADKMAQLYNYLCSVEFGQCIGSITDAFKALQDQLAAEERAFAAQWAERRKQIGRAVTAAAVMYGSIQGIAGRAAIPEIQTLQLPAQSEETPGA